MFFNNGKKFSVLFALKKNKTNLLQLNTSMQAKYFKTKQLKAPTLPIEGHPKDTKSVSVAAFKV